MSTHRSLALLPGGLLIGLGRCDRLAGSCASQGAHYLAILDGTPPGLALRHFVAPCGEVLGDAHHEPRHFALEKLLHTETGIEDERLLGSQCLSSRAHSAFLQGSFVGLARLLAQDQARQSQAHLADRTDRPHEGEHDRPHKGEHNGWQGYARHRLVVLAAAARKLRSKEAGQITGHRTNAFIRMRLPGTLSKHARLPIPKQIGYAPTSVTQSGFTATNSLFAEAQLQQGRKDRPPRGEEASREQGKEQTQQTKVRSDGNRR